MIKAIFWDFFGVINIDAEINPEIATFISKNAEKYRFAILSAANADLHPWLQKHKVDSYFEFVQSTTNEGLSKMDAEFYRRAIDKIKLKPSEILFVDDIESYLKVASLLGIKTILYDPKMNLDKQLVDSL